VNREDQRIWRSVRMGCVRYSLHFGDEMRPKEQITASCTDRVLGQPHGNALNLGVAQSATGFRAQLW